MKKLTLSALALCAVATAMAAKPKVIAHRGYWTTEGSAQNSIAALVKADSVGCYASEFDVWMTADSVLVVTHDAKTPRGLTVETSTLAQLAPERLANGEPIPTLRQYLDKARQLPNLRLVLELKEHNSRALERLAVKRIVEMVAEAGLANRTDYITFSRDAFAGFVAAAPKGTEVYYLTGDYVPEQIARTGGAGVDYHISHFRKDPALTERCHTLGQKVNVWTVDKEPDLLWCIANGVDFITTNQPQLLQRLLSQYPTR